MKNYLYRDRFVEKFGTEIRVLFNWNRFQKEWWPVKAIEIADLKTLKKCFVPWYLGISGEEVNYDDPTATPIVLSNIPTLLPKLRPDHRDGIIRYLNMFRNSSTPIQFDAAAYSVSQDQYLLLDGSHRSSALMLSTSDFSMSLHVVYGPLEKDCLPDLIHWT